MIRCDICDKVVNTVEMLEQHRAGKEHRRKESREVCRVQNEEIRRSYLPPEDRAAEDLAGALRHEFLEDETLKEELERYVHDLDAILRRSAEVDPRPLGENDKLTLKTLAVFQRALSSL